MDLYATLGLDRGASVDDIKRAYRRLARKYHPGINPGDRAAQTMFQRVSEAYETLIDPERRRAYDMAGRAPAQEAAATATFEFSGFDFSVSARGAQAATFTELFAEVLHPTAPASSGPERGADVHAAVTVSFEDSIRGVDRQVMVTRQVECPGCKGTGQVRTPEAPCMHCRGAGQLRWARGHMVFSKPCAACHGTGRQQTERCARCAGHGRAVRTEAVTVHIPPGVPDGMRLRVPHQGHAGRNGGAAGDVYVDVRVQPHPLLRREGDDLHMEVPVAVHEAVLGARITVPSLDGPVKVTVRPSTQAGDAIRVTGRGVPRADGSRGDLVLGVRVVLPPAIDDRSRELMREFGRLYDGDVRRDMRI